MDEIVQTIDRLQGALDDLAVRGLRAAGSSDLAALRALREEFERVSAGHLAERVAELIRHVDQGDRGAARALLRAQASLRVFERILSMEAATAQLQALVPAAAETEDDDALKLADADRTKLLPLLDELARAVEDLLLGGLTTASETTRQTLNVAFQEASRLRLLRLGSTLRVANEELGRFTRNDTSFSRKRLVFFLNRAWLLSHGVARALRANNEAEFTRLIWAPPVSTPVDRLEVVTLGVSKKAITGTACTFEFRLRTVAAAGSIPAGQRLIWACVFAATPGKDIPAESYLHLPQKQKFKTVELLEGKVMVVEKAAVALDEHGGGRLNLGDTTTVTAGAPFTQWERFHAWEPAAALARIKGYKPGPLDLEVELQEEVVLADWKLGDPVSRAEGQTIYPLTCGTATFDAVVSPGAEGKALAKALGDWRKAKQRPPLFGLMHYERCRLVLQPLSVLAKDGPRHLMISDEKLDPKALLATLNLTGR